MKPWQREKKCVRFIGGRSLGLYIQSVPTYIYALFIIMVLLVFTLIKLHRDTVPRNIVDSISKLTKQLKGFETGQKNHLSLDACPRDLIALSLVINAHLKLESDRITHEQMFSSEASHELRTPLAGIRIQAQIAQRTKDPEQQQKALTSIIKAIDRNSRLLQQLLIYSRLTKRRTNAERSKLKLSEIIDRVIKSHQEAQDKGHIKLLLNIDPSTNEIEIESHEEHLVILFDNLFTNAINHTPQQGVISLSLTLVGNQLSIVIEDSGLGVPETEYARIVKPFQKSQDGGVKGTGLGLAICERITSLHEGRLILSPSTELKGLAVRAHLIVNLAHS
jgi:two-component system sensor histidine kinase QseC